MSDTPSENEAEAGAATSAPAETASTESDVKTNGDATAGERAPSGDGAQEAGETEKAAEQPEAPPPEPTPEEKLAASQAATKAMKEKMLRVAADFENYRRRASREVDDARARGKQTAVKDLLPVFDNLERATAHVDDVTDTKSMADGLRMVLKQLVDVLAKMGIERVPAIGHGFDPSIHESIQYEHSDEHAPGIVMSELQPGYKQGDALVRPALVVVSRGPAPPAAEEPAEEAAENDASEDVASEAADVSETSVESDSNREQASDEASGDEG